MENEESRMENRSSPYPFCPSCPILDPRFSIFDLRSSIFSVVFVDPGYVRHSDAKDYDVRRRIVRLRFNLSSVRPMFEHIRQDALALSCVIYLFKKAESEHAAPMGVVFDLVHLRTHVRVV